MTVTLAIANMTCAICQITVRTAIKKVVGVKSINIDFANRTALVVFDDAMTNVDRLTEASRLASFPASRKQ